MSLLPVLLLLLSVCQRSQPVQGLTAVSRFSQNGLSGSITFNQPTPSSSTTITLNITQLPLDNLPWHVHVFPFRLGSPSPCSSSSVAGHFDPLLASRETDYSARCAGNSSLCEMGDLSGKHGRLTSLNSMQQFSDSTLHLHGVYSIIGRSVVIHRPDNTRLACANIDYPDVTGLITRDILYTPFRSNVSGDVYIQQYSPNMTTVYTDLLLLTTVSTSSSENHNWHVHTDQVLPGESCTAAMGHYNPRDVLTTGNYTQICTPQTQMNCEVGDLSGKGGTLDFSQQQNKLFYTDTDLPIAPQAGLSILNRSIVVHGADRAAERIACANLIKFKGREAISRFTGDQGVSGFIRFFQRTPFDQTVVSIYLTGLNMQAGGYHVHVYPVGDSNQCSSMYTGGHFNPRNADYSVTPPVTSDQYEIGDLSGKFGVLDDFDSINLTRSDPNIPLYGRDSIIGRSIVIHRKDGSRWACANIEHTALIQQVSTVFTIGSRAVRMVLTQPANDPFAETTIFIANLPPRQPSTSLTLSPSLATLTSSAVADIASSTPAVSPSVIATSSLLAPSSSALDSSTLMTSSMGVTSSSAAQSVVSSTTSISSLLATPDLATTSVFTTPDLATTSVFTTPDLATTSVFATPDLATTSVFATTSDIATTSVSSFTPITPMSSAQQLSSTAAISTSSVITSSASLNLSITETFSSSSSLFMSSAVLPSLTTTSSMAPTTMAVSLTDQISMTSVKDQPTTVLPVSDTIQSSSLSMSSSSISFAQSSSSFLESTPVASPTPVESSTAAILASVTPTPSNSNSSQGMKKRAVAAEDQDDRRQRHDFVVKRQAGATSVDLDWSIRQPPATSGSTDCAALGVFRSGPGSTSLCQSGEQIACTSGDLSSKHGRITVDPQNGVRLVFTDPSLPLSGPNSVASMVLLLQSTSGGDSVYSMIQQGPDAQDAQADVSCSRPDTITPVMSSTPLVPSGTPAGLQLPVVIGICVGIVVVLILLIVFVILLAVYFTMRKRSTKREYSLPERNGNYYLEMGKFTPSKPVIGVATYRAIHHYKPQHDGDMLLEEDDLVELIETPYGGDWWKGKVQEREREGWFPKDYVEYFDIEAEQKKKKEEEFQVAAAMIKAASYTFSRDTKAKDATTPTIRRMTIDSTPRLVTKFEINNQEGSIDNLSKDGLLLVGSRPDTPSSLKIENTSTVGDPDTDMCIAKYDYAATAETELDLKQGEHVVILERADNGWWHGLVGERHGWFPESFAEPVTSSTQDDATQQTPQDEPAGLGPRRMSEFVAGTSEEVEASEFKAIQTFDGGEEEGNINFSEGDVVLVYWAHDNGWWYGAAGSSQGWFPGSYVEPVVESSEHTLASASPTLPIVEEKEEPHSLGDEIAAVLQSKENRNTEEHSTAQATSEPPLSSSSPDLQNEIRSILGRLNSKSTMRKSSLDQKPLLETEQSSSIADEIQQNKPTPIQSDKPVEGEPNIVIEKKDSVSSEAQESLHPNSDTTSLSSDRSVTPTQSKYRRRAPPPPRPVVKASSITSRSRSPKPHRIAPPTPPSKSPIPRLDKATSSQPSTPKAATPSPLANSPAFLLPSPLASKDSPTPPPSSPIVKVDSSQTVSPQPASPAPVGTPPMPHLKPVRLTTAESRTKKRRPPPTPPGLKKLAQDKTNKLSLSKEEVDGSPAPSRPPPLAPVPAPRQSRPKPKARVQMIKRPQTRNIPPPPAIPLPPPPKRQIPPPPSMKPPQLPPQQAERQSPLTTKTLETTEKADLKTALSDSKTASSPTAVVHDVSTLEASKPPPPVKPKPAIKPKPAVLPKPKRLSQALLNNSSATSPTSPLDSHSSSNQLSPSEKKTLIETTVITNAAALVTMRQPSEPSDDSSPHPVPAKRTIATKPLAPQRKTSLEKKPEETSHQLDNPPKPKQQPPPPRPKPPSFDTEETDSGTKANKEAKPARPPPVASNRLSKPPAQPDPVARSQKASEDKLNKPSTRRPPPARPPPPKLHSSSAKPDTKPQPGNSSVSSTSSSSKFYKATQNYQATENGHLKFTSGDLLVFVDKDTNEEGYLYGMMDDGTTGLFPLSHVKPFEAP